jgi:hypothetical protein
VFSFLPFPVANILVRRADNWVGSSYVKVLAVSRSPARCWWVTRQVSCEMILSRVMGVTVTVPEFELWW